MSSPDARVVALPMKTAATVNPERDGDLLNEIVEWDVRNWSAALSFWRRYSSLDLSRCRALEIGSRGGGLSLWLALQGAQVVCSDVADPDETAIRKHERHGVAHLISYERIDASHIPYADYFDVVVFKSVLGAVGREGHKERQIAAIAQMHKALKPGGELYFAENLTGSWLHSLLRKRLVRWGRTWRYLTISEIAELTAPFRDVHWQTNGFLGAFGRTEGQRSALGLLDTMFFNGVTPARSRYIATGIARK